MNLASISEHNHDVMVVVRGPIAHEMEKVFEYNWLISNSAPRTSSSLIQNKIALHKSHSDLAWISYLNTMPYLENTKVFFAEAN